MRRALATAVGLAAGRVDVMMPILREWDFDALITHNRFTLTNRNAGDMINFARSKGIAVLNAAPYAGGVFAKGSTSYPHYVYQEASGEVLDLIRRIEAICARGVPPGAAALQFSLRDERITSTICGVSRPGTDRADARMGALAHPRGSLGRIDVAAVLGGRPRSHSRLQTRRRGVSMARPQSAAGSRSCHTGLR